MRARIFIFWFYQLQLDYSKIFVPLILAETSARALVNSCITKNKEG